MADTKNQKTRSASNEEPKNDGSANPELKQAFDDANDKGYFGEVQDDADHTVAGVTKAASDGK